MELLAAAGGGAFVLVSLVIGVRVVWLAHRTRGLAELSMGLGLLLMGGLGYPIPILADFGAFLTVARYARWVAARAPQPL